MQKKKKQPQKMIQKVNRRKLCVAMLLCVIGVMLFRGVMQIPQIIDNKNQAEQLKQQIAYEKERQKEIDELKAKTDTDEYIKKVATEKLGLVQKNAKIFIDTSSEE